MVRVARVRIVIAIAALLFGSELAVHAQRPAVLWNDSVPADSPDDPCLPAPGNLESRGVAIGPDQNPISVGVVAGASTTMVVVNTTEESGDSLPLVVSRLHLPASILKVLRR